MGEVAHAADVVEVEVRGDDVPDVRDVVPEGGDLRGGGLGRVEAGTDHVADRADPLRRTRDVLPAEP